MPTERIGIEGQKIKLYVESSDLRYKLKVL